MPQRSIQALPGTETAKEAILGTIAVASLAPRGFLKGKANR